MIAAAGGNSIPVRPTPLFGTRELSDHVAVALKIVKRRCYSINTGLSLVKKI